jgi:hypothetical protein
VLAGGDLLMTGNTLSIGPNAPKLAAAVLATGLNPVILLGNRLENHTGRSMAMLRDWTGIAPVLQDNQVGAGDTVLSTDGLWRHRTADAYHGTKDALRAAAGRMKRSAQAALQP